jgi:hypothetical protein
MDKQRRKELQEEYKQVKIYMGVYRITNNSNGKMYIASSPNLKNRWLTLRAQLDMGRLANSQLQKDWKELGPSAFTYEVLEQKETNDVSDVRWVVKQMEKLWLEKLQPYGDKGYHKIAK